MLSYLFCLLVWSISTHLMYNLNRNDMSSGCGSWWFLKLQQAWCWLPPVKTCQPITVARRGSLLRCATDLKSPTIVFFSIVAPNSINCDTGLDGNHLHTKMLVEAGPMFWRISTNICLILQSRAYLCQRYGHLIKWEFSQFAQDCTVRFWKQITLDFLAWGTHGLCIYFLNFHPAFLPIRESSWHQITRY